MTSLAFECRLRSSIAVGGASVVWLSLLCDLAVVGPELSGAYRPTDSGPETTPPRYASRVLPRCGMRRQTQPCYGLSTVILPVAASS